MDPQRSSNIVDLASRSGPLAHPAAFSEVRAIAFRRLPVLLAEVLDRADDALFDFVQRSKSSIEQQDYFDAMRELRRNRAAIEHRYRDHLGEAFVALERKRPVLATLTAQGDAASAGLSLVGTDDLEEQLAAEQVASLAERRHTEALRQLDRRLAATVGLATLEPEANPAGPAHVTRAFRSALVGVEVALKARLVLYKLFERELIESLSTLLHEANQRLHQHGIMPALSPSRSPQQRNDGIERSVVADRADNHSAYVPQSSRSQDPTMRASGVSAGGSQHPAESVDTIFASVRDLCHAVLEARRGVAPQGAEGLAVPRIYLAERQALSALHSLQTDIPETLMRAVDDPQISLSVLLKQELLRKAEHMQLGDPGAELVEQDEQALFLVGLLFDVLMSQRSYERPVRQQFVRMTVPYARAAMLDQHLFALKTHPARQLLNSLAEACDGNRGESAAERDLLGRVSGVVDRLVSDFNEDIAVFSELESEFRAFLDQHRKRVELAERRAAEAQRGRERLDEARAMASMEVASLMGAREAPPVIDVFLNRYWTHHLAVVFLREGSGAARYLEARSAGEGLWRAFLACEAGADLPDRLRDSLLPILASSGVTGPSATEVLDAVEWVLLAVRLGRMEAARKHPLPPVMQQASTEAAAGDEGAAEVVVKPVVTAATDPAVAAEASPATAVVELHVVGGSEAPGQPEFDPKDVDRIKELSVGGWVEFVGEDGMSIPAKLSWISPISSRLLFVTRRGMRHCAASPQELAVMIKLGQLHLRIGDTAFESAMAQVLGKLREAVPEQAANG